MRGWGLFATLWLGVLIGMVAIPLAIWYLVEFLTWLLTRSQ